MRRRVLGFGDCCYHVVSRINERRFYLGMKQKAHFLKLLRNAAAFSGVEVLTYCIMDDHFHLLVRIPRSKVISERELFRRLKALYRPCEYERLCLAYAGYQKANNQEMIHAFRQRYQRRMYDLSEFVRTLKHRFSLWFNKCNEREGPLWTGRFKSVLVQSSSNDAGARALRLMAAYIDLNAVRADLVERAQDYAWCGFARAVKGDKKQINALKYVLGKAREGPFSSRKALETYQNILDGGVLSKIAGLSSGFVLGQHAFVNSVARRRPECFNTFFVENARDDSDFSAGLCTIRSFKS